MEVLFQKLPKDLVYIIEDYAKDTTSYEKTVRDLRKMFKELIYCVRNNYFSNHTKGEMILVHRNNHFYSKEQYLKSRYWAAWKLMNKRDQICGNRYGRFNNNVCGLLWNLLKVINRSDFQ